MKNAAWRLFSFIFQNGGFLVATTLRKLAHIGSNSNVKNRPLTRRICWMRMEALWVSYCIYIKNGDNGLNASGSSAPVTLLDIQGQSSKCGNALPTDRPRGGAQSPYSVGIVRRRPEPLLNAQERRYYCVQIRGDETFVSKYRGLASTR